MIRINVAYQECRISQYVRVLEPNCLRSSMCLDLDEPAFGVLRFPLLFFFFFLAHVSALGDKVHCSCTVEL